LAQFISSFNSHAIEANLHKIPGLCDRYLFLNDDYMFGKYIPLEEFEKEKCFTFYHDERKTLDSDSDEFGKNVHHSAMKNVNRVLDQRFGRQDRYFLPHSPHFFSKSIVKKIQREFREEFAEVSTHRFRSWTDIHTAYFYTNYILQQPREFCSKYYEIHNGCPHDQEHCLKLLHSNLTQAKSSLNSLFKRRRLPKFLSINDHVDPTPEGDQVLSLFASFMYKIYPNSSQFEKENCVKTIPMMWSAWFPFN